MKIKNFDSTGGASPLPYKLTIHKNPLSRTNPSKNRTIPRKSPTPLPLYERSVGFASCKAFGRSFQASVPLYERSVGFASCKAFGRSFQASVPCLLLPLHRIPPLPKTTINPKRKALKRSPVAKTGNGASVLYIGFTLSIYQHRQQAQRFQVRDYPSSQAYIRRPKFRLFRRCRQASAYSCYRLPCRLRSACRRLYGR